MNFLKNLGKGFIRSMVNQVGRDGGRVISNQVYGDSHSIPIRQVGGQNTINHSSYTQSENLIKEKEYVLIKCFLAFLLSIFLPILGGLIVIYRGIVNFNKKHITLHRIEKQPVFANDRRYKTGQSFEGYKEIAVPVKVEIDKIQKNKNRFKSIVYFLIGLYGFYVNNSLIMNYDLTKSPKLESPKFEILEIESIAISKKLTDLKEEPLKNSKNIGLIFSSDTLQLLNETKINEDSSKIWYKVEYKGKQGWIDYPTNK